MSNSTGYIRTLPDLDLIDRFIVAALAEDAGDGDHTSLASVPANAVNKAILKVKDDGVLAGVELAEIILKKTDPSFQVNIFIPDGTLVKKGDIAFEVEGNSRTILLCERLLLNCMQRMSGIATSTYELVKKCEGTKAKVIDTRKTTPLFRYFEKWAVRIGGGTNHRFGLYDMILIKDNHVDYAGGISNAILATEKYQREKNLHLKVEIEVRNMKELDEVLATGRVHRILLDNFSPADLGVAVKKINGKYETEASGGITSENIRAYAETGVDFISVGALTHHVKSLDLSLKAV
ncbi:MAG TPA: carboxylating nicotinate-nucleotide diphosphorylase [Bacteroidia bacterium]|jgi:nicotinate-nucleotide pyrophosphorylase (carboxylating)|nr:carboxylating nicotinate-nucleotide diphosphorylase [Bacteroidia bacterium]